MARIFPEVPLEQDWDASEMKVYRALVGLPDDYIVFYNVEWLCRSTAAPIDQPDFICEQVSLRSPLGEIDFIVLDPDFGCFVIEVKGGKILLEYGSWISIDRMGRRHS
ncbi:MAG TPA: NERD domain-containing protein, partial [Firmicutes bacterium]|nr:NERD domain-containing protein [Bacillota bacterium]